MASQRHLILQEALTRVTAITVANNFNTNAGNLVLLGVEPMLGPDDPEQAIAIVPDDDVISEALGLGDRGGSDPEQFSVRLPLRFHGLAKADLDNPWHTVEKVVEDIVNAIETDDAWPASVVEIRPGPTTFLEREEGSTTVGAAVIYELSYVRTWGTP